MIIDVISGLLESFFTFLLPEVLLFLAILKNKSLKKLKSMSIRLIVTFFAILG